jgi:Tfp pilus assembly protein PilX
MKTPTYHKNEHGVALVISLMFLAILGMLGTTAYVMTSTDLKIGRNYKQSSQAFYNADGGVQYVIATIENDLKNETTVANGTANILPTTVGAYEPFTAASPSGFNLTFSNITKVSDSPGVYSFTSTNQNPNDGSKAEIDVLFLKLDHDPAFDVGILSEGDITINGTANIDGGIHSNGNVGQNGNGTIIGGVSAVGTTGAGACDTSSGDCTLTPGADRIDVPLITTADFDAWKTEAQTQSPPSYYSGACTYSDPGAGNIYFCDGNITFTDSLNTAQSDVTIIATGDISASGSSVKNLDGKIGVKMIAGGDIEYSGGGGAVLNATFWCNGDYRHNGTGTVEGAIVAGGEITRNGAFNFIQDNNLDDENLPPSNECNVIAWSDSRP